MQNNVMYKYKEYLLKHNIKELDFQRDLQFCDGGMQKYLENKWLNESNEIKMIILSKINTVGVENIFSPS